MMENQEAYVPLKLNLGSHQKTVKGFKNLDALQMDNVDYVHDLTVLPYPFADNSVDEILAVEVLEHIGFRNTMRVLSEWHRILRFNGKLCIQVPDIERMIYYYELQCECVPRKAASYEEYKADPNCPRCQGKAMIHPERWLFAFTGAQKHPYDAHLNVFTPKMLKSMVARAGFSHIEQTPNVYKIILNCRK